MPKKLDKTGKGISKPSKRPAPKKAETVCVYRAKRSDVRVHTPADLARIYRYVVGTHGWAAATCAVLDESGISEFLQSNMGELDALSLCSESGLAPDLATYLPAGAEGAVDEFLDLPPGTADSLLSGCDPSSAFSVQAAMRALLAVLVVIWGIVKKIKLSRLYRFVLRRFLLLSVLFYVLDRFGEMIEKLIPAVAILAFILDEIGGVCDESAAETDST